MGRATFDLPASIQNSIVLLNNSAEWNLSLVHENEKLYLYDGDQVMFIAETQQEVNDFLAGAFLATFGGRHIDEIIREYSSGTI